MIQLDGLTKRQVELLDMMWEIDDPSDIENFIEVLSDEDQADCRTLMNMIAVVLVDQSVDSLDDYDDATEVLDQFTLGKT
jgi:hypothetical protein